MRGNFLTPATDNRRTDGKIHVTDLTSRNLTEWAVGGWRYPMKIGNWIHAGLEHQEYDVPVAREVDVEYDGVVGRVDVVRRDLKVDYIVDYKTTDFASKLFEYWKGDTFVYLPAVYSLQLSHYHRIMKKSGMLNRRTLYVIRFLKRHTASKAPKWVEEIDPDKVPDSIQILRDPAGDVYGLDVVVHPADCMCKKCVKGGIYPKGVAFDELEEDIARLKPYLQKVVAAYVARDAEAVAALAAAAPEASRYARYDTDVWSVGQEEN
ncbi:MAG: hypothetical protein M0R66_03970 [Candidatus Omnitrophica bacterium]|nr:hypothetical protein [Candidatus Omnitrophota bacterium]